MRRVAGAWLAVTVAAAAAHDSTAPWMCADPRKRKGPACLAWDEPDASSDPRPLIGLHHMDPAPAANLSCCGLPPVACDADTPPPLSCLRARVPFGEPPACVRRRFECCLRHWMTRFGLVRAYAGKDWVACKGRLWDVADVGVFDVVFDARSLLKLSAAFVPRMMLVYEENAFPDMAKVDASWRDLLVVAKLGFGWYQVDRAPPNALILAHNLVHNPALNRTAPALELPRGVKKGALWAAHCRDADRLLNVRCAGFKLHRGRHAKFLALRRNGVCADPLSKNANHIHTGMLRHEDYAAHMFEGRYVTSMPGVGWENFRDTEAVVAGAVPILEDPPFLPQRPPFHALLDEVPHVLVKNETAWDALRPAHLPDARPDGDARKHYLPYWLHAIFAKFLEHGLENATAVDVAPRPEPALHDGKPTRPGDIAHFPYLDPTHVGCRWARAPQPGETPQIMHRL